jgi:putative FmdB family regulatory protein
VRVVAPVARTHREETPMPTYEYGCTNGHTFEVEQRITEEPLKRCQQCKAKVQRLLSAPRFILKGGGWYSDGYSGSGSKGGSSEGGSSSSGGSDSSSSSPSSPSSSSSTSNSSSTTKSEPKTPGKSGDSSASPAA